MSIVDCLTVAGFAALFGLYVWFVKELVMEQDKTHPKGR
jgi:hypothetical protein